MKAASYVEGTSTRKVKCEGRMCTCAHTSPETNYTWKCQGMYGCLVKLQGIERQKHPWRENLVGI